MVDPEYPIGNFQNGRGYPIHLGIQYCLQNNVDFRLEADQWAERKMRIEFVTKATEIWPNKPEIYEYLLSLYLRKHTPFLTWILQQQPIRLPSELYKHITGYV